MRTINDFCCGTLIRAIRAKWDTLGNKDELYLAAAAIEAIKEVLERKQTTTITISQHCHPCEGCDAPVICTDHECTEDNYRSETRRCSHCR